MLSIGIVGLPNVGKSSTFNALTKAQNAQAANYPFCTIEPNIATVPLPDARLDTLAKIADPERVLPAVVNFVDIAGLVRGANAGEGMGNAFLSHIKNVNVILHLVRAFDDENITHVEGDIDALRDIKIIDTELILADMATLERRIERLARQAKSDKTAAGLLMSAQKLLEFLGSGARARDFVMKFPSEAENFAILERELRFLSAKDVIYGVNISETAQNSPQILKISEIARAQNTRAIAFCAKIEEELLDLPDDEKHALLQDLGLSSGLSEIVRYGFEKLGLINFFTVGKKEVRAWTVRSGALAPEAAGAIHNDFTRGFIRAQVISFDDFVKFGGENGAKNAGVLRTEGKDYAVKDGDIMHFLFNV